MCGGCRHDAAAVLQGVAVGMMQRQCDRVWLYAGGFSLLMYL